MDSLRLVSIDHLLPWFCGSPAVARLVLDGVSLGLGFCSAIGGWLEMVVLFDLARVG